MLSKRVQVLFEEADFISLAKIAEGEDTSVGNLVRKAVDEIYLNGLDKVLASRRQVWDEVMALRKKVGISKRKIDYKDLVSYGKKW